MTDQIEDKKVAKTIDIVLEPFTIYMLVGPSQTGKSTFAQKFIDQLYYKFRKNNCLILSTDINRQTLNNSQLISNLYQSSLTHAAKERFPQFNEAAFELFYGALRAYTAPGVSTEYIILDSTGLSETYREEIYRLADNRGYNVQAIIFDISKGEIFKDKNFSDDIKQVIDRQSWKLRNKATATITQRKVTKKTTIKHFDHDDWNSLNLILDPIDPKLTETYSFDIPETTPLVVIGDVHEDVVALTELINAIGDRYKDRDNIEQITLMLIGDYLDKGNQTLEILDLLDRIINSKTELMNLFNLVLIDGNHESYVYKRLKGILPPNPEHETQWARSIEVLEKNEQYRQVFFNLYENYTIPFAKIKRDLFKDIYITHAPCLNKYLGKMSQSALKYQRNRRMISEDIRDDLKEIFDEADWDYPIQIHGHVPHVDKSLNYKNQWYIDTGSVHGGKLTALIYEHDTNSRTPFVIQVDGNKLSEYPGFENSRISPKVEVKPFDIKDYNLSPFEYRQINRFVKSKARFISGTMSPCGASDNGIEPVEKALVYYASQGVKEIIATPKYMGSRGQIYLFKNDPESDFMTSRSGVTINPDKHIFVPVLIDRMRSKMDEQMPVWTSCIMDGEITPWSALGSGLIERDYHQYLGLIRNEHSFLQRQNETMSQLDFGENNNVLFLNRVSKNGLNIEKFNEQLDLFGYPVTDENIDFKFFNFLELNGEIRGFKQFESEFRLFNSNAVITGNPEDPSTIKNVVEYFDTLTNHWYMEGMVIRPHGEHMRGDVAPYMKIRNEEYLRLIYGYNYKETYMDKLKSKNVSGKTKLSIKEANIGLALLSETDRHKRTELAVKMFFSIKEEKKLDPRL